MLLCQGDGNTTVFYSVCFTLTAFASPPCPVKVGAYEDTSVAFLMYAPSLVWMVMMGRILQASSDNLLLSVALEIGALMAEVLEARGE